MPPSKPDPAKPDKSIASAAVGSKIAAELIAGPLTGAGIGYLIEAYWPQVSPFALIGGFILGTCAAFYTIIKQARQAETTASKQDN